MQLSVDLYGAQRVERGANLDSVDLPLNNRAWLSIDEVGGGAAV